MRRPAEKYMKLLAESDEGLERLIKEIPGKVLEIKKNQIKPYIMFGAHTALVKYLES